MVKSHFLTFYRCKSRSSYKLFTRHSIEMIGNFMLVPFLLFLNPVCSYVDDTGNRITINERGNGYDFARLCRRCCVLQQS